MEPNEEREHQERGVDALTPEMAADVIGSTMRAQKNDEVIVPDQLATAILMFFQYLVEDWRELPEVLVAVAVELNNRLGHESYTQKHGEPTYGDITDLYPEPPQRQDP